MKPKLLDLFCCEGGAGMGYHQAGFDVTGVDITPQPRYPFRFIQADALDYLAAHGHEYDAIHASPPCQGYSYTAVLSAGERPLLIDAVRTALQATGKPFVIENVPGAPVRNPLTLCGTMFGLDTTRHRLFECEPPIWFPPAACNHAKPNAKMGRKPRRGKEFLQVIGNFSDVAWGRVVMQMPWASQRGLSQAIPPAYTRFIGAQLLAVLETTPAERL